MKLMIVDDEPIVREGLKTLIDWSELGFTILDEASDGNEAVNKILDRNPDLVIMDIKMPELSGVEVTEVIRQKGYCGKIIILSGYSDFTYAQTAIRLGVESYLLKPVDEDELIAALNEVRGKIEQKNILEIYNKQDHYGAKNMLLKHILTGSIPCLYKDFERYGLSLKNCPFQLVILDYSFYKDIDIIKLSEYWIKLYQDYKPEFITIDHSIVILISGPLSVQYFADHIFAYINKAVQEKLQRPFVIISDTFNEVSSLPDVYQKLKNISNKLFFYYEKEKPLFCKNLEKERYIFNSEKDSPIEFIENIYKAILDKNASQVNLTVQKLYRVLQNRDFTIEQTFQFLINCIVQIKALLNKTYIKEFIEFDETKLINEICNCSTLFEIMQLLNTRFTLFCYYVKNPLGVKIIEKVLNYIDIHYNEDLKLEKIADLFGYNPAYLGRMISDQLGINFNLYIERKRLDKAIDILVNTDMRIPDISVMIGYQNVEYFYRKFKKHTNLTPGNYRAHHCKKDNKTILF